MTKTEYENIAYDLLENPEYYHNIYRVQVLKSLSYADASGVMQTLEDKDFLARAEKFYQGFKYPTRRQQTALENIRERKEPLRHLKRTPQHFIDFGIWYANGASPEGLPLHFSTYGDDWLQWQARLGMHMVRVRVREVDLKDISHQSFIPTEAFLSRGVTDRDLPFAGAEVEGIERRRGRVWWMATFPDGPVTVEVKNIKGLTQIRLEDVFNNSTARVELRPLGYGRMPQTSSQDSHCPICGGELMFIGRLGQKDWFRCRNCGMDVSKETKRRAPQVIDLYATPSRKLMNELERLWKAGDTKEFYRVLDNVKDAIKERERGKIKRLPEISLTELRDIKNQADRLYR